MGSGAPRPPGLCSSYAFDPAPSSRAPAAPEGRGLLTLPSPPTARIVGPPSGHGPAPRAGDPVPLGVPAMAVDRSLPILIVDDYKTMLRIIRNLLHQLEFTNIDDASDGAIALQRLREKPYGLVISDWNMQPMTGLELLREVRADPRLWATPFIMVTAESKTENVLAAQQAGVSNYIAKPFNAETLRAKIASVLGPFCPLPSAGEPM